MILLKQVRSKKLLPYVTIGAFRSHSQFFYDLDTKSSANFTYLVLFCKERFKHFSIWKTQRGYHVRAAIRPGDYEKIFRAFKRKFKSDYRKRSNYNKPCVLRIAPKWDAKTGEVFSPAPKYLYGNYFPSFEGHRLIYRTGKI